MTIKVRRQRQLLSRLEDEMVLVRDRREEVRSRKKEFCFNFLFLRGNFYRTQVSLGSDLWIRLSETNKQTKRGF